MAKIYDFNLTAKENLEFANHAFEHSEFEKAVGYATSSIKQNPDNIEAMVLLASIYSILGTLEQSNKWLYRAFARAKSYEEKMMVVSEIVKNCCQNDDMETAEFYLTSLGNRFREEKVLGDLDMEVVEDAVEPELEFENEPEFTLVFPKSNEFYYEQIEKSHELVQERKFDEALQLLDEIDENCKFYNSACHLKLVCLLLKEDLDRVVLEAEQMLKNNEYLPIRCTLITALMLQDKNDLAREMFDELTKKEYFSIEEMSVIMPLCVSFQLHEEVLKYAKRLIKITKCQPQTMLWMAQAQFNLGEKEDAKNTLVKVKNLYPEYDAIDYYLKAISNENTKNLEYCIGIPLTEIVDRQVRLKQVLFMENAELMAMIKTDSDFRNFLIWAFKETDGKPLTALVYKLNEVWCDFVSDLYIDTLITKDGETSVANAILLGMMQNASDIYTFITLNNRCKVIDMDVPKAFLKLPSMFQHAFVNATMENVSNIDDATDNLEFLTSYINSFATLNENGELEWLVPNGEKAMRFKSAKTLLAVMVFNSAFEDENDIKHICEFYDISIATFKKYWKLLNGEKG